MSGLAEKIRYVTIALLLIFVAFGAYFFFYVQGREKQMISRQLRLLDSAGSDVNDALEGLFSNLRFAASVQTAEINRTPGWTRVADAFETKRTLIPGVEKVSLPSPEIRGLLDVPAVSEEIPPSDADSSTRGRLAIWLDQTSGEPQLTFLFSRRDLPQARKDTLVAWRTVLRDLVEPTLPSAFFDGLFLVDAHGEILITSGSTPLNLQRLDFAQISRDSGARSGEIRIAGSRVFDVSIANETRKFFMQPIRLPHAIAMGDRPFTAEDTWYLAGYVNAGHFRGMTTALSPTWFLVVFGVLAFGVLALPLVRLCSMGEREKLKYADLGWLAMSAVLGSSLVAFFLAYAVMCRADLEFTDDRLLDLSRSIQHQLRVELDELDRTLGVLTNQMWKASDDLEPPSPRFAVLADSDLTSKASPFFDMAFWVNERGEQKVKWAIRETPTPMVLVNRRDYFLQPLRGYSWQHVQPPPTSLLEPGRYVQSIRSLTTGREAAVLTRLYRDRRSDIRMAAIESRLRSVIGPALPRGDGFAIVDQTGLVQFHSDRARNLREHIFRELVPSRPVEEAVRTGEACRCKATYRGEAYSFHVEPIDDTPWALITFEEAETRRHALVDVVWIASCQYGVYLLYLVAIALLAFTPWGTTARHGEPRSLWYWPDRKSRRLYDRLTLLYAGLGVLWVAAMATPWQELILTQSVLAATVGLFAFRAVLAPPVEKWGGDFAREEVDDSGNAGSGSGSKPSGGEVSGSKAPGIVQSVAESPVKKWTWRPRVTYRDHYTAAVASLLVLVAVLPAMGIFRVANDQIKRRLVQGNISSFMDSVRQRERDQLDWFAGVPTDSAQLETIWRGIHGTASADSQIGFYVPAKMEFSFSRVLPQDTLPTRHRLRFPEWVPMFVGGLDAASPHRTASGTWGTAWQFDRGLLTGSQVDLAPAGMLGNRPIPGSLRDMRRLTVRGRPATLHLIEDWRFWFLSVLTFLLLGGLVRAAVRHAFLGGFTRASWLTRKPTICGPATGQIAGTGVRIMLLRMQYDPIAAGDPSPYVIDVIDVRKAKSIASLLDDFDRCMKKKEALDASHRRTLLLTRFEQGLKEPEIIGRKLELVEAITQSEWARVDVYIEASIEPLEFLTERLQERYAIRGELGISVDRWAAALEPFTVVRSKARRVGLLALGPDPKREDGQSESEASIALKQEVGRTVLLGEIGRYLKAQKRFDDLRREDVVEAVREMAQAHYRRWWTSCSSNEKLLLHRIAREGLVTRSAKDPLRPLVWRGLVMVDPACRLMNESFRRFVLDAERPEVFAKWENRGEVSLWARLRTPLLLATGLLAAFFFATQQQAWSRTIGLVTVVTGLAPGALSILTGLRQARTAGEPTSQNSSKTEEVD